MPYKEHFDIYKNGARFKYHYNISEAMPWHLIIGESSYKAGDVFDIKLKYDWNGQMSGRDMTLTIYSKQDLSIKDKQGYTNMLHYDGNSPSGFTSSKYKSGRKAFTAEGDQKEI